MAKKLMLQTQVSEECSSIFSFWELGTAKSRSYNLLQFFSAVPPSDNDDDFEKWQKQISEAEVDSDRPSTPPEGEEEFIDDGTRYKWDRGHRAWVSQVGFSYLFLQCFVNFWGKHF